MRVDIKQCKALDADSQALALVYFEGEAAKAKGPLGEVLKPYLGKDFHGKKGEITTVPTLGRFKAARLVLTGLGKKEAFHTEIVRQIAGAAARHARRLGVETLDWDGDALNRLPKAQDVFRALAEGMGMGLYTFDRCKGAAKNGDAPKKLKLVRVFLQSARQEDAIGKAISKGTRVAEAVNFARDLVSAPANWMTPTMLADAAARMAKQNKLRCRILSKPEIRKIGMNSFLSVAQGSEQEPRFIILEHRGGRASDKPIVLVGKGITFDSGGISLKPALDMDKMKYDMAGGAAVLGAMNAIGALRLPVHVVGVVPACENLPSGKATKPGDVIRAMNGKTIEILNTDAEGRLILADALSYVDKYKPRAVVDLATLTGACIVALGHVACAVMGNDARLVERIRKSSERTQERAWELPLWKDYSEMVKSDIADVKNLSNRGAGTITAAAFLKEFVGKYPWAHLDIAGVAWEDRGVSHTPKGASGFGVRLLTDLVEEWSKKN